MWTHRDWALVATSAVGAFGLTLAAFWSGPLNAVDQQPAVTEVQTPTFHVGNCDVMAQIVSDDRILGIRRQMNYIKAGEVPKMQLVVVNTTHDDAQAKFHIDLQTTQARDRMSRIQMIRPPAWSQDYDLKLKGNEKKVIEMVIEKVAAADRDMLALKISTPASVNADAAGVNPLVQMMNAVTLISMAVLPLPPENGAPQPASDMPFVIVQRPVDSNVLTK